MPKLVDSFNENLYKALVQCGFNVSLGTEVAEVTDAELKISEHKALRLSDEDSDPSSSSVSFLAMLGDPTEIDGGGELETTPLVFSKKEDLTSMVIKIKKAMATLMPVESVVPETSQEVPEMTKKDLEKKRDNLLDKLNKLPEGDPRRDQVKEQLNSLKAGLHRISFDIEVPEKSGLSLEQYVEALQQLHLQLSGKVSHTAIQVSHVRDPLPKVAVGDQVKIANDVDVIDTVYFAEGFHSGYHIPEGAVDLGQYQISVKKGTTAVVNSILGSHINLIEVSSLGVISAYDHIKRREISNQVQVHSCTVNLQDLKRVD